MAVSLARRPAAPRRPALTQQQKYNRGMLPQLTSPSDTRIRYPIQQKAKPKPFNFFPGVTPGQMQAAGQQIKTDIANWAKNWNAYQGGQVGPMTGGGPSYAGLIGGDWEVQDAEAAMASRMASLRGDFQSNLRSALVGLGISDKSKLGSFGGYIDADTIQKATENKYSTMAQIAAGEQRQNRQNQAALAARGILSSGQLTKGTADITAEAEKGRYSALQDFLAQGQAGLRTIADEEYGLSRGVAQARQAAAMRAAELYQLDQGAGYDVYGDTNPVAQAQAAAAARGRAGWKPFQYGRQGSYMTKQTFMQQRPQGNYQNYLNYLRRARGGRL